MNNLEYDACAPLPVGHDDFNTSATIPYGCKIEHIYQAMQDFVNFLGFINMQLFIKEIPRLESMLMPANFSSLVGEFIISTLPKYCPTLVKNLYHNGHPDLIPMGMFEKNAIQHASEGIEIKASRYRSGWQGHNPEKIWLMVFVFDSNRPIDITSPKPFRFIEVLGAALALEDWSFSGRSATSRRTITASVTKSGYEKLASNWIYRTGSR